MASKKTNCCHSSNEVEIEKKGLIWGCLIVIVIWTFSSLVSFRVTPEKQGFKRQFCLSICASLNSIAGFLLVAIILTCILSCNVRSYIKILRRCI